MKATRFDTPDELWASLAPGGYCITTDEDGVRWLWFLLPIDPDSTGFRMRARRRIPDRAPNADGLPAWDRIDDGPDGITVHPSINAPGVWHGWLERGEWRSC